jgi:hypothetical protein
MWLFSVISMDTTKMKYLQTIGIHRMFLNVAKFNVQISAYVLQKRR